MSDVKVSKRYANLKTSVSNPINAYLSQLLPADDETHVITGQHTLQVTQTKTSLNVGSIYGALTNFAKDMNE
jgi:hypothetical protein